MIKREGTARPTYIARRSARGVDVPEIEITVSNDVLAMLLLKQDIRVTRLRVERDWIGVGGMSEGHEIFLPARVL